MSRLLINRRRVMLSAAAALPAFSLATSAQAQSPASPTRNAGYYRFRVGDIQATVLSDGLLSGPPGVYAGDAPEAELREVLRRAFLPTDAMTLNLNTLLIEAGGRRVLIEAGAGQTMGPNGGRLFDNLAAIGLTREDIDHVVISHTRSREKIAKLGEEIERRNAINAELTANEDKQISLTDPDARSMATSGRDTGIVGYNVQTAVDTENHLVVAHEVTNVGTDRRQLAKMAKQARAEIGSATLDVVADRGYYEGYEIRACEEAGITVFLPKPMTSTAKADGRFGRTLSMTLSMTSIAVLPVSG